MNRHHRLRLPSRKVRNRDDWNHAIALDEAAIEAVPRRRPSYLARFTSRPKHQFGLSGGRVRQSVQLLWRGMAEFPRTYFLAVSTSALFGAATVAVSRAVGWATDQVVVPAIGGELGALASTRITQAALLIVACALALAFGIWGRRIWAGWGQANLIASHRRKLAGAYIRLPVSWHRAHPTGALLAHASADADAATRVFNALPFALGVVVMFVVAAISLLLTDPWLALAAFVMLPIMIGANAVFSRHMSPAVTQAQLARARLADVAHESFDAALLVKSLGAAAQEETKFAAVASQLQADATRVGRIKAVFDPVIDFLPSFATLLVLLVGVWRVHAAGLAAGQVVSAAYLMMLLSVPVRSFGWVLSDLPPGIVGRNRLAAVIDDPAEIPAGHLAFPDSIGGITVTLDHVSLDLPPAVSTAALAAASFMADPVPPSDLLGASTLPDNVGADLPILRDISAVIAPGQITAVVGSTGAGKTTLVSLLARLFDPTSGRVLFDGVDLRDLASLPGVAYASQQPFIFEDTVRGNVTFGERHDSRRLMRHVAPVSKPRLAAGRTLVEPVETPDDDAAVWAALRAARVDEVVAALPGGLDSELGERGANLSGGQRQRIAIARALYRQPRLLILDDATSAVDAQIEAEILAGLAATNTTVVIVAYRMSSINTADSVLYLENGRLVAQGTPAELLHHSPGFRVLATAYESDAARRRPTPSFVAKAAKASNG